MSNIQDYETKLPVITAIEDDQIKTPNSIPVDIYIQEAENLYHWCQADKDELTAKGLSWELVDDIPIRCGTLREAESLWNVERFSQEEMQKRWAEESPLAYDLRNELLHSYRFAFSSNKKLSGRVDAIADGSGHADMIQDLNDLSVLGRENQELLAAINFDMSLIDRAAQLADEMALVWAGATGDRVEYSETKKIRDQAYTHLKEAVDKLYAYGQYVLWHDDNRLKGYRSNYLRRKRLRQESKTANSESSENSSEATPS